MMYRRAISVVVVLLLGYFQMIRSTQYNVGRTVDKIYQSVIKISDQNHECTIFLLTTHSNKLHLAKDHILSEYTQTDKYIVTSMSLSKNESKVDHIPVRKHKNRCVLAFLELPIKDSANLVQALHSKWSNFLKFANDYFVLLFEKKNGYSLPQAEHIKNQVHIFGHENSSVSVYNYCNYCRQQRTNLIPVPIEAFENENMFPNFLKNLDGKQFTVSCPIYVQSVLELKETSKGNWEAIRGRMLSVSKHLMDHFNFTAKHIPSKGGGTGRRYPNGTWDGTVGDILSGRADIGQVTAQVYGRDTVVSFSRTIIYIWLTFTTGLPQPHYTWTSVYRPYKITAWICILVISIASMVVLYVILKVNPGKARIFGGCIDKAIIIPYQTMMEQDFISPNNTHSFRLFICFWLMFCLLISTIYRSKLVIFLLFPNIQPPPTTFDELAASKYHIALHYVHGAAYSIIKSSTNPTFKNIFNRMELEESDVNCLSRVTTTPKFACISWQGVRDYAIQKNVSDRYGYAPIKIAQERSTLISLGFIYRRGFILREKFDYVIGQAFDMGLIGKWEHLDNELLRKLRDKFPEYVHSDSNERYLKLGNLGGTFFLWLVGLAVTLITFPSELLIDRLQKSMLL